jgi:hypothetical protein
MMKHCLRDASQEESAQRSEPTGSEDDQIDIAIVRTSDNFPGRIALCHPPLDGLPSVREPCGRGRQHAPDVHPTSALIPGGLPATL